MPRETGKGEKEYRKRNGGLCKWYTYLSARSRNPEDGAPTPATYVPVHVLPLHGCENYKQGGNAFLPLYAKNPRFTATYTLPLP